MKLKLIEPAKRPKAKGNFCEARTSRIAVCIRRRPHIAKKLWLWPLRCIASRGAIDRVFRHPDSGVCIFWHRSGNSESRDHEQRGGWDAAVANGVAAATASTSRQLGAALGVAVSGKL
jgi:hypothetical protein